MLELDTIYSPTAPEDYRGVIHDISRRPRPVKKIRQLEKIYTKPKPASQRIIFGQRRTKFLIALVYWCKDFCLINKFTMIDGLYKDSLKKKS